MAGSKHAVPPARDLELLLSGERERAEQPLVVALLERRLGAGADAAAADRLLRAHAPWALDLPGAARSLMRACGDRRSRRLFVACCLRPGGRSQGELGAAEGVSAQRVGQIVHAAGGRVRAALAAGPEPLRFATAVAAQRLGSVVTERAAVETLQQLGAARQPAAGLLLWLAGPYLPVGRHPGWLAVDPRAAVSRTAACLAADGGVRRLADVEAELADLGLHPAQVEGWLSANGAVVRHGLSVAVGGQLRDAVERILDAHGAPRTLDELVSDLAAGGRAVDPDALRAVLRGRRFEIEGGTGYGLRSWGPPPGDAGRGKPAGGPAPGRRSPAQAGRTAAPSRSARRAPTASRDRRAGSSGRSDAGLARGGPQRSDAGLARGGPQRSDAGPPAGGTDRARLAVLVDAGTLRGAAPEVPAELARDLGLAGGSRRTFSSRWGPVTLTHDGSSAGCGSLRAVALARGARAGDTLLLGFSAAGDVTVELLPARAERSVATPGRGSGSLGDPEETGGRR